MNIIKRDGSEAIFEASKIGKAISKANDTVEGKDKLDPLVIKQIQETIEHRCSTFNRAVSVEEVQDMVEKELYDHHAYNLMKNYMLYRYQHQRNREGTEFDSKILSLLNNSNEEINQENANKNPVIVSTQRDYMAGEVSKEICKKYIFDDELLSAHSSGIIHIHDTDYIAQSMYNCSLVNLEDMLQNGTVISGTKIDTPKSFATACNVATQILAQVASSQFGGQTLNLYHLVPFVESSRAKIRKDVEEEFKDIGYNESDYLEKIDKITEKRLLKEIENGVQTIQYQILTLMTTNGQSPFSSIFIYLNEAATPELKKDYAIVIEAFIKQRIKGVKNRKDIYIPPTFPKILYVLEDDNIKQDQPYFYLTRLAAECTAKRMVPDYISEKKMKELKEGNVFGCMGCRSFLSVWKDPTTGKPKFWGRFNKGVCTINVPDVALTVIDEILDSNTEFKISDIWNNKDLHELAVSKFFTLLDKRLELCHKALLKRYDTLKGTKSDVAPILWQDGALARLKPGETIDSLLVGGYSTTSLGYVGLFETVKSLTGLSHTDPSVRDFAISIVKHLSEKCDEWNKELNLGFSLYGTPEESTTYKFAKTLQKHTTKIAGVNDKNYVINSYHVDVKEDISAFDKLSFESQFQDYTTGGAISYVEVPNMANNIPAIIVVLQHIYENVMYAEMNCKLDCCMDCGYEGEILLIKNKHNKLIWKCPNCGCTDQSHMNIVRRVCGYLSNANVMNQGRLSEIGDRKLHL